MGETGFATRVLSPSFCGLYTYAAPASAEGTAAGQVTAQQMRRLYRIDKLSRQSKVYGVIADPVRHSISPAVHNRAFQARRLDSVYLPFLVSPAHLKDFVELADALPIAGFSVTIPHKQKIIRYLDAVDPLARRIGAVNTVWRKAGKWRGANTDAAGVTVPLSRHLRPAKSSILIIGNGGAARGAACALLDAGAKVTLTGRNPDRVRALAKACGAEPLAQGTGRQTPFRRGCALHAPRHVAARRRLLLRGRNSSRRGFRPGLQSSRNHPDSPRAGTEKTVIPGIEMFIEQAVRQFEIFTGESAPRAAMEKAALEALEQSEWTASGGRSTQLIIPYEDRGNHWPDRGPRRLAAAAQHRKCQAPDLDQREEADRGKIPRLWRNRVCHVHRTRLPVQSVSRDGRIQR